MPKGAYSGRSRPSNRTNRTDSKSSSAKRRLTGKMNNAARRRARVLGDTPRKPAKSEIASRKRQESPTNKQKLRKAATGTANVLRAARKRKKK